VKPLPKGLNTGITVHGWWKIDVRNPDGKLVRHVEFENNLMVGGATGDALLTGLLGRTLSAGSWAVVLIVPNGSMHVTEPASAEAAICNYLACSSNLSVVPGTAQLPGVLTLTGFVVVPPGVTSISSVSTDMIACNGANVLPAACVNTPVSGINNGTSTDYSFTQANVSVPSLTSGQLVNVSVTFSFQ
jgi:hypothetical protein